MRGVVIAVVLVLAAWYLCTPRTVTDHSQLKDKVVVITDAASGVGAELALKLAGHGAKMLLVCRTGPSESLLLRLRDGKLASPQAQTQISAGTFNKLKKVQQKALDLGSPQVEVAAYDYGNITGVHTLVDSTIELLGAMDYLVLNHEEVVRGSNPSSIEMTRSLNVNVLSYIELVRKALPHLNNGHIFISSSILGAVSTNELPVYSATKHALNSFFYGIQEEIGKSGATVTLGELGEMITPDRQPLFDNIPKWARGDVVTGAQTIMDTLITRQSKLMYPKVHCYLARVRSLFA